MNCIIFCSGNSGMWVREYFPNLYPYEIRVANKLTLEFWLDFCALSGIKSIKIIFDQMPSSDLIPCLGDGGQCGVHLSCSVAPSGMTLNKLLEKYHSFYENDDLLLVSGLLWVNYNKNHGMHIATIPGKITGKTFSDNSGYYIIPQNCQEQFSPADAAEDHQLEVECINSVEDYFCLSRRLLEHDYDKYSLPGYGREGNVFLGIDVSVPLSSQMVAPVIIGNHVHLEDNTIVGPNVVIGNNVIVDKGTTITNSVIVGNSYIGRNSEITEKIIFHNHIIDPARGVSLNIVDDFLLSEIQKAVHWSCSMWHRVGAVLLMILFFIPFCYFRTFIKIRAKDTECFIERHQRKKLRLRLYLTPSKSFSCRYFRKLSLDRYHLLPQVAAGNLRLVGSKILQATKYNSIRLDQFPDYAPGLFSYSEYLNNFDDEQWEIDELYYIHNASFILNCKIIIGVLFRNLMKRT